MDAVEHGRPGMLGAESCESVQVVAVFAWIAEWTGHGQRDAVGDAIGDGRAPGCGEPVVVAAPSSHERHGFASKRNDFVHTVPGCIVDHGTVTQTIPRTIQCHDPEHRADALIDGLGQPTDRNESRFHPAEQTDRQQTLHIIGNQFEQLRRFVEVGGNAQPVADVEQSQQDESGKHDRDIAQNRFALGTDRKALAECNHDDCENQRQRHCGKHRMQRTMSDQRGHGMVIGRI